MAGCGQIVTGAEPLQLRAAGQDPDDPAVQYQTLELAMFAHLMAYHPDVAQSIALFAGRYGQAITSKLYESFDPAYKAQQHEAFKMLYWSLMGELSTNRTAGKLQEPPSGRLIKQA
jgi:hypothetical protein